MARNDMEKSQRQHLKFVLYLSAVITVALVIEVVVLKSLNKKNSDNTSLVLLNQVVSIIEDNEVSENQLVKTLKEDYVIRAKTVAYILDSNPGAENDVKELQKIADLMRIDEIHLFDESGTLYSGTIPEYYGFTFDSGEQIAYFKPMLLSKERTMCQDVTPNTAEGKNMMYAITWNEAGDKMVQVGVEPLRLMDTLQNNEITAVMDNIPTYEGIDIMVAEVDTGTICGSTNGNMLDKNLSDIGIDKDSDDLRLMTGVRLIVDGNACYCSVRKKGDYIVVVADAVSNGVKNLAIGFAIEFVYLLIAGITLCSMFKKMVRSNDEKEEMFYKANADQLTGLYNRRAYEDYITECNDTPPEDNFVFVSMDVNGLKPVNDNLGHAAGDELLTGAAGCMKHCMGQYGNIYRTGGDEFIAIIFANDRQLHDIKRNFKAATTRWSGKHVKTLSVSCGFVAKRELVGKVSIHEMADIADKRMYEAKERFYKKHPGYERRVAR